MNYKLTLAYNGAAFCGWQVQLHKHTGEQQRTVQGELERAVATLEGERRTIHGAGRTDAGVHAEAQVANVRMERALSVHKLRAALNGNLPPDVRVIEVEQVADDFHARFSATGKTYRYRVFNAPFVSPFLAGRALTEMRPLDVERMKRAAMVFIGRHDWTAFSSAQSDVQDRVRCVTQMEVCEYWNAEAHGRIVEITASAEGFLRFMVRSIAGTLLAVGRGEIEIAQVEAAIRTGNRALSGATAAAHGLTLVRVHYDSAGK